MLCHLKTDWLIPVQQHESAGETVSVQRHRTTGDKMYDSTCTKHQNSGLLVGT